MGKGSNMKAIGGFFLFSFLVPILFLMNLHDTEAQRSDGTVRTHQKISNTSGGFTGILNNADHFGSGVANVGDIDGDGVTDLVVGAYRGDDGGTNRGAVYVLFMNVDGTVREHQKISQTAGGFGGTLTNWGDFGLMIGAIGDWDGDGVPDIAVGERGRNDGGTLRGGFWIILLNSDGTVKSEQLISQTSGGFGGVLSDVDKFGSSITVIPDLDGDGVDEWVVGAPLDDDGGTNRGAVYVLFMNADGTVKDYSKISSLTPNFTDALDDQDRFGSDIQYIGDLDGDGVPDIVVGAWQDDDGGTNRGAVYILFLTAEGGVKGYQKISDTEGGFSGGLSNNDYFGFQLAVIDDLDGDGVVELAVGALGDDDGGTDRGAVWILYLNALEDEEEPVLPLIRPRTPIHVGNPNFTINQGSTCTDNPTVTIDLEGTYITDVVVSEHIEFIDTTWEPADLETMSKSFVLSEGDGEKTVYLRYRSCTMNQTFTFAQKIQLSTKNGCPEEQDESGFGVPIDGDEKRIKEFILPEFAPSPVTGEIERVDRVEKGDVIKGMSYKTVYAINNKGRRMPFINEDIYYSWYSSFDVVKVVSDATLSVISLCHPVDVRPESTLVKFPDDNKVYYPELNDRGMSTWRWLTSESLTLNIFGVDWSSYIMDIPTVLRPHVQFGENIDRKDDIMVDKAQLIRSAD